MTLSKDDGRTVVHPNEQLTYTIAFANDSDQLPAPGAAWNVTLKDTLPTNTSYQSCAIAAPLAGSCGLSAGIVTFNIAGKIDAGASGQVLVTVKANPATAAGTIVNDVALSYTDDLGNPFGASASDTDALVVQADLSLTKSVDNPTPHKGDQLTYTIVVSNDGPDGATNVAVSDPLPADVSFVGASASQGGYDAGTGEWNVGALAPGASARLDIAVLVDVEGTITNTAQVSAAGQPDPDSTPNNNDPNEDDQASVTTPIAPTAVTLTAFTAQARGQTTQIDWSTSQELDTWSFDLYRSDDGSWEHAARVTPQPILAHGRGQNGASYSWTDTTGAPGQATAYWLVETETGGATNRYGPATVARQNPAEQRQVFVPLIIQ